MRAITQTLMLFRMFTMVGSGVTSSDGFHAVVMPNCNYGSKDLWWRGGPVLFIRTDIGASVVSFDPWSLNLVNRVSF